MNLVTIGTRMFIGGAVAVIVLTVGEFVTGAIPWHVAMLILGIQATVAGLVILIHNRVRHARIVQVFTGTCVVCGESVSMEYRPSEGLIDIAVDEDRQAYTWIRHIDGPQSGCEIYSSPVRLETSNR